jgi:site-specific DNA-methyltransferase (adenine-specific)
MRLNQKNYSFKIMIELHNCDNMELMSRFPDKYFELAIVDPPYGIGNFTQSDRKKIYGDYKWNEETPNNEYFLELKRVSKNRIIWGANYYNCFEGENGAIIWNKENYHPNMSNCEIASISFGKRVNYFEYIWNGARQGNMKNKETRMHPCQKPVALYKWLLKNYAKPNEKILDTHLGSASIAIACYDLGFDLVGCELDTEYFEASKKRIQNHISQGQMFLANTEVIFYDKLQK